MLKVVGRWVVVGGVEEEWEWEREARAAAMEAAKGEEAEEEEAEGVGGVANDGGESLRSVGGKREVGRGRRRRR